MAHFLILKRNHEDLWHQLMDFLEIYRIEQNLPENWVRYGLWRWKEIPSKFQYILEGKDRTMFSSKFTRRTEIIFNPLVSPCVLGSGVLKGNLSSSVSPDLAYIATFLKVLGEVKTNENLGALSSEGDGAFRFLRRHHMDDFFDEYDDFDDEFEDFEGDSFMDDMDGLDDDCADGIDWEEMALMGAMAE